VINNRRTPPAWFRSLQIGSGIISLTLSIWVITIEYPILPVNTAITLLSITLLTIGIERVATGLLLLLRSSSSSNQSLGLTKTTRLTNIGLGTVALVFAIIALIFPRVASGILLILLSIAISVMFNGFGRIIQGVLGRHQPTWFRIFSIVLGALSTGAGIFVSHSDTFGIVFPIRALSIVLLIHGIGMIAFGTIGKLSVEQILKK
jgi:uncharacterized membrane protein HdeD (DUF308 family)